MFTSLRSRLWLSYAALITVALLAVIIVLFVFLLRNPVLYRTTQQRLRLVQTQISDGGRTLLGDTEALTRLARNSSTRILIFDSQNRLTFDSNPEQPALSIPRRGLFGRVPQVAQAADGSYWLQSRMRLSNGTTLVTAAPRPRINVLNVFADELFVPLLEGGAVALLLSLVLAFALSQWVADPLQNLVVVARNYPAQTSKPVQTRGPREVQDLTRAFNSMIDRVESAQQSQRDFVANVSHELKTPLTSIQGFAQAILDGTVDSPESLKQSAQVIHDEAGRMHRMALDLLDLARLEGGTAVMNMSMVEPVALLRGVAERFSLQAQKAGIDLRVVVPDDLPSLIGDGDRLAQVFNNLVDNALKFTPGNGEIVLSAAVEKSQIKFLVSDSGLGVEPEALPRLFDRFYQVDSARAGGESHGAGLGLAIAQEIVQAHGGKIGVRSSAGHGATFTIHLPLVRK